MSMGLDAHIKQKCLDEEKLEELMSGFFKTNEPFEKQRESDGTTIYFDLKEKYGVIIYFVKQKVPPHNIWDSEILKYDFEHSQLILFDVNKFKNMTASFIAILKFCRYINQQTHAAMLIVSDSTSEEFCYMQEDGTILETEEKPYSYYMNLT